MEILGKQIKGISQGTREITLTFVDNTVLIIIAKASVDLDEHGIVYARAYLDLRQKDLKLE